MPIISSNIDAGNSDGYDFSGYNAHLTITSNVTITGSQSCVAVSFNGNGFDWMENNGSLNAGLGIFMNAVEDYAWNTASGTIMGYTGIESDAAYNTIQNDGRIYAPSQYGISISGDNNYIGNTGTIIGLYGVSIQNSTNITIINSGVISGASDSVKTFNGYFDHRVLTLSLNNTGTINGTLSLFGYTTNLYNNGEISGDIDFGNTGNILGGRGGTVDGNIVGGSGDDLFDLSHQIVTGTITGGGGNDTISFNSASGGFAIDLGQGTASGAGEAFDFSGIEKAVGTHYGDTILGDANDNIIAAGSGNDVVAGGGGNDTIDGGAGNDALDGGSGNNTVAYVSAASGVTVSLGAQGSAQATGGSGSDTLSNFQNITGSAYADKLIGDGNANVIHGGGGNDLIAGGNGNNALYGDDGDDTIVGGTGNDRIEGDAGRDTLTGGAGADTFVYKLASDSTVAAPDLITDFTSGSDKIDISALHTSGSDTFTITSNGGYTYVSVDQKGDGTVDTLIKLTGTNILGASDVIWGSAPAAAVHAAIAPAHAADPHLAYHTAAFHAGTHDLHLLG